MPEWIMNGILRSISICATASQAPFEVEDGDVGRVVLQPLQSLGACRQDFHDVEARALKLVFNVNRDKRLIFQKDDRNSGFGVHRITPEIWDKRRSLFSR